MLRHSMREGIKVQFFGAVISFFGVCWVGGECTVTGSDHWAYQRAVRPALPRLPKTQHGANAIDHFIIDRLARRAMTMSTPAKPQQQARRVFLDLIGRPPQPGEIDDFLANPSEREYGRMVDRLLANPQYGEKWARRWLDLARYADSNGFQADQLRDSWAYRDWVIDAFNSGMPFDQFTIEQLAGDLLPNATSAQKVATGFHRTPTCNVEAGVHPESNRVNQVIDRVNTTGTVFLGTTLECAQCHDHKYDPFSMSDYYRMLAFFNNTPLEVKQQGDGVTWNFYGPTINLSLTPKQQARRAELQREIDNSKAEKKIAKLREDRKAIKPHTTLVMSEMSKPRQTKIMLRGNYLTPGDLGIKFDCPIDVSKILVGSASEEPTRPPRLPIVCTVEVADSVTTSRNQVLNISTRGFRVRSSAFKVGEKLFVEITGMPRKKAVARWTGEGETGFEFLMPLSYGELESWTVRRQSDTQAA